MVRIGRDRARCESGHFVRTTAGEPVCVGQNHESASVVRRRGHDVLVRRTRDLGHAAKRLDRGGEGRWIGCERGALDPIEQVRDVRVGSIGIDGGRDLGVNVHGRGHRGVSYAGPRHQVTLVLTIARLRRPWCGDHWHPVAELDS